jgi:hypothetical protein
MQDLGKITIDILEGGASSAGGAAGGMGGLKVGGLSIASIASELVAGIISAIASAIKIVVSLWIKAVSKVYEAFMQLRQFVLAFVDDIREYSPAVQLADLGNEMAMIGEKMRAANMGGALSARVVSAEGEIERSLFRFQSVFATAGAAIVGPILKQVAKVLQYLETFLPKIIDTIGYLIEWYGKSWQMASNFLPKSMGGDFFKNLGVSIEQIGRDIRDINLNTKPNVDFLGLNKPFLDDLRLMGARV